MKNTIGYFGGSLKQFNHFLGKAGAEGHWDSTKIDDNVLTFSFNNGGKLHWWFNDGSAMFVDCTNETITTVGKTISTLLPEYYNITTSNN